MKNILAIIVPCFNEEEVLKETYSKLCDVLKNLTDKRKISKDSFICFVDDGSADKSWQIITEFSKQKNVKGIKLSKNFGHQAAILAGLTQTEADIFITIDADLQDDINAIGTMVDKYLEGNDIVYGVRNDRKNDSFAKRTLAQLYYRISSYLGVKGVFNHADFRLMSKKAVNALKDFKEYNVYLRGLVPSLGFKSCCVYYRRSKRIGGKAKYNFFSLSELAINGITSFSTKPLLFISILGFVCFSFAVLMSCYTIWAFFETKRIPGWASLFISLYFLGGIQLLSIGIIGEYIGKIYKETKERPKFIIEDKIDV